MLRYWGRAMHGPHNPNHHYLSVYEVMNIFALDTPMVVLTDNMTSWVSRRIKFWSNLRQHEKHHYSHACWLKNPEMLASQGVLYRRIPLTRYLRGHIRLKFWYCTEWDELDLVVIRHRINVALRRPWWRRIYDGPGIIGQWLQALFGWGRWLNLPFLHFCAPQTLEPIQLWTPGLPLQSSPAEMDRYFENNPHWKCYGIYDPSKRAAQPLGGNNGQ